MTRDELDKLWQQALQTSVAAGEEFIRYHFAAMVAKAEREACAQVCDEVECGAGMMIEERHTANECAKKIRARGEV